MRIPVDGGDPEVIAWGFRNPFGLAIHEGRLFVVDNGYDERGSRPVWGTGDILWELKENQWYGWPNYSGHHALNDNVYKVPGKGNTKLLLKEKPTEPPHPVVKRFQVRHGLGAMPAFDKKHLSDEALDHLLSYLKALKKHS